MNVTTCLNRYGCLAGGRNELQRNDTIRPGRTGEPRQNVDSYDDVDSSRRGYHRAPMRAAAGAKKTAGPAEIFM